MKRIGCLHAHHGNIGYLDEVLAPFAAEAVHFVDPALVRRIGVEPGFSRDDAQRRVAGQLVWMAASGLDGIVITCTAYAASLPNDPLPVSMPVLTVDEPFFAAISRRQGPIGLVFTNPGTVEGTLRRLGEYGQANGYRPEVTVEQIDGAFDLFMAGRSAEHDALVVDRMGEIVRSRRFATVAAGQLSLSRAAKEVSVRTGTEVVNLLDSLAEMVGPKMGLSVREL